MAKSKERIAARKMRRRGASVKQIAHDLGVSRGSVSLWCRDVVLSQDLMRSLTKRMYAGAHKGRIRAAETNRQKRLQRVRAAFEYARQQMQEITVRDLFVMGVGLYWAEGSKKGPAQFGFANSDPQMVVLILRWLSECFTVTRDDVIPRVIINRAHQERERTVVRYWSKVIGVPIEQFRRTTFTQNILRKRFENHNEHFGTLHLRVRNSSALTLRILASIAIYSNRSVEAFVHSST